MIGDPNLVPETEQFSFIRTIDAEKAKSAQNDDDGFGCLSLAKKVDSQDKKDRKVSALCTTSSSQGTSLTTIDNHTTISDRWYNSDNHSNPNLSTVIILPESELKTESDKSGFHRYLDRILLILAGGYLCFVFWWLFGRQNAIFPITFFSRQEIVSQADREFIDYMKQSLEIIDRKVAQTQSSASQATSSEETASEVVYVPVYTPTPKPKPSQQISLPQPNNLLPPPPPNPPLTAVAIPTPPAPSESVKIKTTPDKINSQNSTFPNSTNSNSPETVAKVSKPKIKQTLVGVMELKEGSAALFKVRGVTQRIFLGEKIENTEWVLDSVSNQKVKISRQGKTLTLNVGDTF